MKKLTLNVDEIQVTGFEVAQANPRRGTVNGAEAVAVTRMTVCDICSTYPQATCLC